MLLSYLISAIFRSRSLEKPPNQTLSQTLPSLSLSLSLFAANIVSVSLQRILHFCDWEKSQRIEKRFTYTRSTCCWWALEERKEGRKEGSRDSIKIRLETGCGRTTLILVELILKINRIFVVPPMILLFSPGGREGGDGLLDVTILAE